MRASFILLLFLGLCVLTLCDDHNAHHHQYQHHNDDDDNTHHHHQHNDDNAHDDGDVRHHGDDPDPCPQHLGPPCPIYYNNTMEDYKEGNSTADLLALLKSKMSTKLAEYLNHTLTNMPPSAKDDYTFYYGTTGRAALFLKLWANTNDDVAKKNGYLLTAKGYIDNAIKNAPIDYKSSLGFFQSFTGTYAIGAVIYYTLGDTAKSGAYIKQVISAMPYGLTNTDYSFDTGVAGLLQSALYLNFVFNTTVVDENDVDALARYLIDKGIYYGKIHGNGTYLLWEYDAVFGGWQSYGQGHGMFGTLQRLLDTSYAVKNKTAYAYVKATIDLLVSMQLPSGQFPDPFHLGSLEDDDPYPLVQWCHGAPGALALYTRAWEVYGEERYVVAAEKAADYVWERGLLAKGLMNCHGITGNTYMFLILYKATKNEKYLWRALKFQEYVLNTPMLSDLTQMRVPTPSPYSVWQGSWVGASVLWADMLNIAPQKWCVPGFERCL